MTRPLSNTTLPDLRDFTLPELQAWVRELGEPSYRGGQIFRWLYQRRAQGFAEMSDLPKSFRQRLAERARIGWMEVRGVQTSRDGTRKFLLELEDGERIEAVLIPEGDRLTACLSTQAGCPMGCTFCLTATMGLKRNLRPGEIVGQILALQDRLMERERVSHIVLMGMGEPLANYTNTEKALRILTSREGVGFSPRRITLSTVGVVPGIYRLAQSGLGVNLAISLTATTDELRNRLMPINVRHPLQDLLQACREFPLPPRRRMTFEYVLMAGVNDAPEDAHRLAELLKGIRCKVNLIPLNEAPEIPFRRPSRHLIETFQKILEAAGYTATIRESRGNDISAACGMLATRENELDSAGPIPYSHLCGVEQSGSSLGS